MTSSQNLIRLGQEGLSKQMKERREKKKRGKLKSWFLNKKERQQAELMRANREQKFDKEMKLAEQAASEEAEYMRVINRQIVDRQAEQTKEEERKKTLLQHAEEIKKQILLREETKILARKELLEEGRKIKQKEQIEKLSLEQVKLEKLAILNKMNVEEKFVADLRKYKI